MCGQIQVVLFVGTTFYSLFIYKEAGKCSAKNVVCYQFLTFVPLLSLIQTGSIILRTSRSF